MLKGYNLQEYPTTTQPSSYYSTQPKFYSLSPTTTFIPQCYNQDFDKNQYLPDISNFDRYDNQSSKVYKYQQAKYSNFTCQPKCDTLMKYDNFGIPSSVPKQEAKPKVLIDYESIIAQADGKEMTVSNGIGKTKVCSYSKEEAKMIFGNVSNSGRISDELKYKTEMCKNWIELGFCQYRSKCRFAHGSDEIKHRLIINDKYRSKPCQEFHNNLYCSYGVRCLFSHSESKTQEPSEFTQSLYDPRLKIDKMTKRIMTIIQPAVTQDPNYSKQEIMEEIKSLIFQPKSKFGFSLVDDQAEYFDEIDSSWDALVLLLDDLLNFLTFKNDSEQPSIKDEYLKTIVNLISIVIVFPANFFKAQENICIASDFLNLLISAKLYEDVNQWDEEILTIKNAIDSKYYYDFDWKSFFDDYFTLV